MRVRDWLKRWKSRLQCNAGTHRYNYRQHSAWGVLACGRCDAKPRRCPSCGKDPGSRALCAGLTAKRYKPL